jgi:hypothetical protein
MFNIIYRGSVYTYQCESPDFQAGMIATFSGNRGIKIANDKDVPIGFFINDSGGNPFERVSFLDSHQAIAVGQGEYVTDVIEPGEYTINDFLYCSCNGKITNEKIYWGNIIIGIVNSVEGSLIGFVTCFAKGLESIYVPINDNVILNSRYDLIKSK